MNSKKSKTLELELIDELLDEESEAMADNVISMEASEQTGMSVVNLDAPEDLDLGESDLDTVEALDLGEATLDTAAGLDLGDAALEANENSESEEAALEATEVVETLASVSHEVEQETVATGRIYDEPISPLEVSLSQNQSLSLAQDKILELEEEINKLRIENEELASAGKVFKDKTEELVSKLERIEKKSKEEVEIYKEEKNILLESLKERGKKMDELLVEKEQLQVRLKSDINKVRVRERELENRLEIVKLENIALGRTKDEIILDLKRQVDQLVLDLDKNRIKGQALNDKLDHQHEALHRTVKALRIALSMLEGENSGSSKAS